jgi:hypothetical protein
MNPKAIFQTISITEDDTKEAIDLRLLPFDCIEVTQENYKVEQCIYLTRRQALLVATSILKMLGEE